VLEYGLAVAAGEEAKILNVTCRWFDRLGAGRPAGVFRGREWLAPDFQALAQHRTAPCIRPDGSTCQNRSFTLARMQRRLHGLPPSLFQ
jgi:hypothetical protein